MGEVLRPDICVIGAGSGGLTMAAGASQMGAETVLVERSLMGGDCLNYGCVPSKALLAAARAASEVRRAPRFGVDAGAPEIDFARVHASVQGVIARIAPQDSVERFTGLGVRVIQDHARFTGPRELVAGECTIRARRFVVATGAAPLVPPIPGIEDVPYHTNETIFGETALPGHLLILGGGPIGVELGQAFARLGARVTILEAARILPRDDQELVEVVRNRLRADGVAIHEGARVEAVERRAGGLAARVGGDGPKAWHEGTHLLVALGRGPVTDDLGLEAAGVIHGPGGITIDCRQRTTNKRIYAIGDVAEGYRFTHTASHGATVVLRHALFRLPAKAESRAVPWVTYTEPELAHVGLAEDAARAAHGDIRVLRWPFAENDRAWTDGVTDGLIKAVTTKSGRILGTTIVGHNAGELIQPWVLAIGGGLRIGAIAKMIAPYPTLGEVSKRAAGTFYMPKLFSERTKKLVRLLARLG